MGQRCHGMHWLPRSPATAQARTEKWLVTGLNIKQAESRQQLFVLTSEVKHPEIPDRNRGIRKLLRVEEFYEQLKFAAHVVDSFHWGGGFTRLPVRR